MAFHFIVTCVSQKKTKESHSILDPQISSGSLDEVFAQWQALLKQSKIKKKKAIQLYNGGLWGALLDAWGIINGRVEDAHLWVMSAGHGLISAEEKIVPYDITFQDPRDGIPSILAKVNFKSGPAARQKVLQKWWEKLSDARTEGPTSLESILGGLSANDYALVILGKGYLDAVYPDLQKGLKACAHRDHIAVISNNVDDPVAKRLGENWLFADGRLVNLPNSNNTLVNAKIAHKLLYHMFEEKGGMPWWSLDHFNVYLKELGSGLPKLIKHDRTPSSDEEVKNYIRDSLRKTDATFSKLHRAYRDEGRACEYTRFRGLYKAVKEELRANASISRPTMPVKYKRRKAKMLFFLPDWDDRVDPLYDFEKDEPTPDRDPYEHDAYHYELYGHLNCDGILVSKTVLEDNAKKKQLAQELGIHKYLRLPRNVPVLGDCGAFNYIVEEVPPFTTEEILEYYQNLDFDYGVSIDHLIVPGILKRKRYLEYVKGEWASISQDKYEDLRKQSNAKVVKSRKVPKQNGLFAQNALLCSEEFIDEEEQNRRYYLTINNAREFIRLHKKGRYTFCPIGAVQGWSPKSYAFAVSEYQKMGYNYIALGGLVRSSTKEILEILEEVARIKSPETKVHLFGVARLEALKQFMELGVTSVDSAGVLRQAWLSSTSNYHSPDGNHYTAIRVPPADKGAKAKKSLSKGVADQVELLNTEQKVLSLLREYDHGKTSLERTHTAAMEYQKIMEDNNKLSEDYLRTLSDKPWKKCGCKLCNDVGIDIVVFRRNNRNRRRGFHNTFVFFEKFKELTA